MMYSSASRAEIVSASARLTTLPGGDPPVDLRHAEGRLVGGDREVAPDERDERAAEAPAVDHRDRRLRVGAQHPDLPVAVVATHLALDMARRVVDLAEVLLEVHSRRERVAGPGQH